MKTIADGNDFDTEVIQQTGVVLVDFYTDGCGPCRMMMPTLEELAIEQSNLKIVKVDAAANNVLAANFRVSAVPTFVLFNNGQVKGQFTGARSKKDLLAWIDSNR